MDTDNEKSNNSEYFTSNDVLNFVAKYLRGKDLSQAGLVCRNWNTIFKQELYRRSRLETRIIKLFIPSLEKDDMSRIERANEALRGHIIDIPEDLGELRSNMTELGRFIYGEPSLFNNGEFDDEEEDELDCLKDDDYIFNSLDFTPKLCIIFTTCSSEPRLSSNVIYRYQEKLPKNCDIALVQATGLLCKNIKVESEKNIGLGFFFPQPSNSKLDYKIQCISSQDIESTDPDLLASLVIENLITNDDHHNCLIFFNSDDLLKWLNTPEDSKFEKSLLENLKKKLKPGKFSLIGSTFTEILAKKANEPGEEYEREIKWLLLRISSPSLKSWSLCISNNWSKDEKEKKILEFYEKVELNDDSMAIVVRPIRNLFEGGIDSSDVQYFREIFTDVCIHEFKTSNKNGFCFNSSDAEIDTLETKDCNLFMIISQS